MPPGLTLPNTTSATALPASTPGNHASRMAGASSSTLPSVSGRPLKSTTTNGLPVALMRSTSSSCSPGQVDLAAGIGLAALPARLAEREHDLVGGVRGRHGGVEPRGRAALARVRAVRRLLVGDRAALGVRRRPRALLLDAVEDGDGVRVLAPAPPRAEHVVLVLGERTDHRGVLRLAQRERGRGAVVLEQHHRAPGRLARLGAVVRGEEAGRVRRLGLVDVGMLEQPGAELHAQDPPHRVVDPRLSRSGPGRAASCRSRGCSCSPSPSPCRR